MRDFANDVLAFMDAVGLQSAVVVGHSMGGSVAQRLMIDHPARSRARARGGVRGVARQPSGG
jgi:non-heme chloroperoxidase